MVVLPTPYKYNEDIFDAITKAINQPSNYSETYRKIVDDLQVKVSHRDYSKHLKKLVSEHWINKEDSGNRGKSVTIELTEKAKKCRQLKIGFSISNRYEKAYQCLLNQASTGSTHLIKMTEPQAGYAAAVHPVTHQILEIFSTVTLEGVSENDLVNRKHHGSGGIFRYLVFTKNEVQEYFKLLIDSKILIPISVKPEIRYSVIPNLKEFFADCWSVIPNVIDRMEIIWKNMRRPSSHEEEWYELLFGHKVSMIKFARYNIERREIKQYYKMTSKIETSRYEKNLSVKIQRKDAKIKNLLQNIRAKHADTIKEYSHLTETLLKWVYPGFSS